MSEWWTSSSTEGFKRTAFPGIQGISLTSQSGTTPSQAGITLPPQGVTPSQPSGLELAIRGTGFFQIKMSDTETGFTRMGSFSINSEGVVAASSGSELHPRISIPSNRQSVTVASNGEVSVLVEGSTSATHVGNIQLAKFVNPEGLQALGMNRFTATEASGTPLIGTPGTNGFGTIVQSSHESSQETSEVEALVDQIAAERQYEMNSSALQSEDLVSRGPELL